MDKLYAIVEFILSPFILLWLHLRRWRGKEDPARWRERLGFASVARPKGTLLWLHAASVGESVSALPLLKTLRTRWPEMLILVTTGTRTSAALMQKRLPQGVVHQYVPVDTKDATRRFMRHWQPDIALFVESEFWPNLLEAADTWQCCLVLINARMSKRSFAFWRKYPALMQKMLSYFAAAFAQSEQDAARLKQLGMKNVEYSGNLKFDGEKLPCDENRLLVLKNEIGTRPVWLAASTHPGEEILIAKTHALLAATRPDLLTIIAPRHPGRGHAIAKQLSPQLCVALRSKNQPIAPQTSCYIADTLGELGLFYRLSDIVFMGGSLAKRGGQNPLEAARLSCAILTGPHTHNFPGIYRDMETSGGCRRVTSAGDLAAQVGTLMGDLKQKQALQTNAMAWVNAKSGAIRYILDALSPVFNQTRQAS